MNFIMPLNISDIICIVIQSITTVVIFFLAFGKDKYWKKQESKRERVNIFYAHFYQKLLVGCYHLENKLSSSPIESRAMFLDLFANNIQYMGTDSQHLFFLFYLEFMNLCEADDNNPDYPHQETSEAFDAAFINISKSLLSEYMLLCKQLKLPQPLPLF